MKVFAKVLFPAFLTIPMIAAGNSAERAGSIKGRIIDDNQNTLPGAVVYIDDKTTGVISDIDGFYSISGLTPGHHNIKISYVGYSPVTETIEVTAGGTVSRDIKIPKRATRHAGSSRPDSAPPQS